MATVLSNAIISQPTTAAAARGTGEATQSNSQEDPKAYSMTKLLAWLTAPLARLILPKEEAYAKDDLALSGSKTIPRRSTSLGAGRVSESPAGVLLRECVQIRDDANGTTFEYQASTASILAIANGYKLNGTLVCPVSVIMELVLEAAYSCPIIDFGNLGLSVSLKNAVFEEYGTNLREESEVLVRIASNPDQTKAPWSISLCSNLSSMAHGELSIASSRLNMLDCKHSELCELFSSRTIYDVIFPRFLDIPSSYRSLQSVKWNSNAQIATATALFPLNHDRRPSNFYPALFDSIFQLTILAASIFEGLDNFCVVERIGEFQHYSTPVDLDCQHILTCSLVRSDSAPHVRANVSIASALQPTVPVCILNNVALKRVRLPDGRPRSASTTLRPMDKRPLLLPGSSSAPVSSMPQQRSLRNRPRPCDSAEDVWEVVADIIRDACHLPKGAFAQTTELLSLGVDSLMLIEILAVLQHQFPHAHITTADLSRCRRVVDVANAVVRALEHTPATYIDRPFMPRADSNFSVASTLVEYDELEADDSLSISEEPSIKEVLSAVLGIPAVNIEDDSSFECYGLDSLASLEALHMMRNEFGIDIEHDFFSNFTTPREAQAWLSGHLKLGRCGRLDDNDFGPDGTLDDASSIVNIQLLSNETDAAPLYLIHDGSGLVDYCSRLASLDRDVYGIQNPYFGGSKRWASLKQMAEHYADLILDHRTGGSLIIGGWSFGGVVAYEMTRILLSQGVKVDGLLLIDSPSPLHHVPLSTDLIHSILKSVDGQAPNDLINDLHSQFAANSELLKGYQASKPTMNPFPTAVYLRCKDPLVSEELLDVPTWISDRSDPGAQLADWEELLGQNIRMREIPGHHFEVFQKQHVNILSNTIAEECVYLESLLIMLNYGDHS